VGLSGKSVIPFVIATGCAIPGIMACRTIRNERERRATAMLAPFMPCGAKLPVIALFAGVFFGDAALSFLPAVSEWPAGLLLAAGWVVFIAYDVILTACGIWYKHRFAGRVPGADRTEESAFVPPEIILSDPGQNAQEAGADTTSDAPRHTDME
jgi:hypothetical protein